MTLEQIKSALKQPDYQFLKDHPDLGSNIMLIGLGGSHAYGTEHEGSDLDIRGVATNSSYNILCRKDFEQVVETNTDTVIYSVDKLVGLLESCNPNTIELLGLKPEHYLHKNKAGQLLIDNRKIFLSQLAIYSFGGYATDQLRRMENKSARVSTQAALEENMLKSINKAMNDLERRHFPLGDSKVEIYLDDAVNPSLDKELFLNLDLRHYPLRDYANLHGEMLNIVKQYAKNNHRNTHAITHDKLGKHMMHLVRLYYMCIDILEKEEIVTFREQELPLLLSIRNGDFLDEARQPIPEFYDLIHDLEAKVEYAAANTSLPKYVDKRKISDLLAEINQLVLKGALNE